METKPMQINPESSTNTVSINEYKNTHSNIFCSKCHNSLVHEQYIYYLSRINENPLCPVCYEMITQHHIPTFIRKVDQFTGRENAIHINYTKKSSNDSLWKKCIETIMSD